MRFTKESLAELLRKPGYSVASGTGALSDHPLQSDKGSTPVAAGTRWTVTLPWPPSANHYAMPAKNGGRWLTKKTLDYRAEVKRIVNASNLTAIGNKFRMEVELHYPDKRRRDLDNSIKQLVDSLGSAAVIADDHWMRELYVRVVESTAPSAGKAVVTVEELV